MRSLIVLDLNGAILDAAKKIARDTSGKPLPYLTKTRTKFVYLRPGAIAFLEWLLEHFDVGIWTSCIERNAREIVNGAIPERLRTQFKFLFHRGQCELVPGPGYKSIKDLRQVWARFSVYGVDNTYAIDDTASKYSRQPDNLVLLKEWKAGNFKDTELTALRERLTYLQHVGH